MQNQHVHNYAVQKAVYNGGELNIDSSVSVNHEIHLSLSFRAYLLTSCASRFGWPQRRCTIVHTFSQTPPGCAERYKESCPSSTERAHDFG